jgi:hypothetical protein
LAIFSPPVHVDPGVSSALCTVTPAIFPEVKRPGRGLTPPPFHLASRLKKV